MRQNRPHATQNGNSDTYAVRIEGVFKFPHGDTHLSEIKIVFHKFYICTSLCLNLYRFTCTFWLFL